MTDRQTDLVDFLGSVLWDAVVDGVVDVEVERLERVKEEVAHVLVHVRVDNATVEVVDDATSVHHLAYQVLQRVPWYHLTIIIIIVVVVVIATVTGVGKMSTSQSREVKDTPRDTLAPYSLSVVSLSHGVSWRLAES